MTLQIKATEENWMGLDKENLATSQDQLICTTGFHSY